MVWADYVAFLNDPKTQQEIDESKVPIRYPRGSSAGELHPKWKRDASGHYSFPPGRAQFPLSAVTTQDVEAFLAWKNAAEAAAGSAFEYALPTELEWEKAARGVDRRFFPFGNTFVPTWVKGRFAHARLGMETTLRFPIDESPYGVFDLCGSLWEICADPWDESNREFSRAARGGSWSMIYEANFRAASRADLSVTSAEDQIGFRLVAHKRRG
jgi:formylglycine-generating enzyme required for sulfatase activity